MGVQINGVEQISGFGDYEEGIFTPQIADNNLNGSGESQAYTTQIGRYTKVGQLVTFSLTLIPSSLGCLATCERARIVGLPFTSATVSGHLFSLTVGFGSSLAVANATENVAANMGSNKAHMDLYVWDATGGTSNLPLSEFTADGNIYVAGSYEV